MANQTRSTVVDVVIDADVELVWQKLTDWPLQSEWMLATTVRNGDNDGRGVGGTFEAVTGVGPLSVTDPMVVTTWDPPRRVDVHHLGGVVRGSGVFEVFALPSGRSRIAWTELVELPLGVLGLAAWPIVRAAFELGARRSLQRFRRMVEGSVGGIPLAGRGWSERPAR